MKEIKLHYTEALIRQAVRAKYLARFKNDGAWLGILVILCYYFFIRLPAYKGKDDCFVVVIPIVAAAGVVDFIQKYRAAMRQALKTFRAGRYKGWTLSYTEEQFTVSAESFSHTTPWKFISMATQRPTYWILDRAHSEPLLLPLDSLDAEDREFITRKTQTALSV